MPHTKWSGYLRLKLLNPCSYLHFQFTYEIFLSAWCLYGVPYVHGLWNKQQRLQWELQNKNIYLQRARMLIFFKGIFDKRRFVETFVWECSPQCCFCPHMKKNHWLLNILRKISSKTDQRSLLMSEEAASLVNSCLWRAG